MPSTGKKAEKGGREPSGVLQTDIRGGGIVSWGERGLAMGVHAGLP